jgi:hypothetical protein
MPGPGANTQVTFRLPADLLAQADEEATHMARPGYAPGRADVLRLAVARGLEAMRAERLRLGGAGQSIRVREYQLVIDALKGLVAAVRRFDPPMRSDLAEGMTLDTIVDTLTTDDQNVRRYLGSIRHVAVQIERKREEAIAQANAHMLQSARRIASAEECQACFTGLLRGDVEERELMRLYTILTMHITEVLQGRTPR